MQKANQRLCTLPERGWPETGMCEITPK